MQLDENLAYLIGVLHSDGSIYIFEDKKKNNKMRSTPQYMIRIASYRQLTEIKEGIQKYLKCAVHFEKEKSCNCTNTCFYLSRKNAVSVKKLVYPHIVLPYKVDRLRLFFEQNGPARI